jgi:signal transduction histidine kinase
MVEILRLEASTNTQVKSDFISCISHELRSPLHGIMTTIELMQKYIKDSPLLSMMDMIESCSSTLLDTFDNLLEFVKINGRVRDAELPGRDSSDSHSSNTDAENVVVDLVCLVEEILEIVLLGHSAGLQMEAGLRKDNQEASANGVQQHLPIPLLVTAYVERSCDFVLILDPGAWKRIILNIVSNALKYTEVGSKDAVLKVLAGADGGPRHISFSAVDTGVGMSQEFLKYHIFTPRKQENALSPGTGLGLSMVKSIVESFRAKLLVENHQQEGTRIIVNIPLHDKIETSATSQEKGTSDSQDELRGLSLSLMSIESDASSACKRFPRIVRSPKVLQRCIRNICENDLGMTVFEAPLDINLDTDVVFLDIHSVTDELDLDALFPRRLTETPPAPAIILGSGAKGLSHSLSNRRFVCINSPITGKKLLATLHTTTSTKSTSSVLSDIELSHSIDETTTSTSQKNDVARSPRIALSASPENKPPLSAPSLPDKLPERPKQTQVVSQAQSTTLQT